MKVADGESLSCHEYEKLFLSVLPSFYPSTESEFELVIVIYGVDKRDEVVIIGQNENGIYYLSFNYEKNDSVYHEIKEYSHQITKNNFL
jgi:hypothetical protein